MKIYPQMKSTVQINHLVKKAPNQIITTVNYLLKIIQQILMEQMQVINIINQYWIIIRQNSYQEVIIIQIL